HAYHQRHVCVLYRRDTAALAPGRDVRQGLQGLRILGDRSARVELLLRYCQARLRAGDGAAKDLLRRGISSFPGQCEPHQVEILLEIVLECLAERGPASRSALAPIGWAPIGWTPIGWTMRVLSEQEFLVLNGAHLKKMATAKQLASAVGLD